MSVLRGRRWGCLTQRITSLRSSIGKPMRVPARQGSRCSRPGRWTGGCRPPASTTSSSHDPSSSPSSSPTIRLEDTRYSKAGRQGLVLVSGEIPVVDVLGVHLECLVVVAGQLFDATLEGELVIIGGLAMVCRYPSAVCAPPMMSTP